MWHHKIYLTLVSDTGFLPEGTRGNFTRDTPTRNHYKFASKLPWWRHQMETFSALLALCAGNSPVHGEFFAQRPVTRSYDVYFDMHPINGWVNNREAGDLTRHHTHYDVILMLTDIFIESPRGNEFNVEKQQRQYACRTGRRGYLHE